jgi:hypothetical protein
MCCFWEPNWCFARLNVGKADANACVLKAASHDHGRPTLAARTWSPPRRRPPFKPLRDASLIQRQNAVVGECELREIAGATPRRVAITRGFTLRFSVAAVRIFFRRLGASCIFCKLRRTLAGLVVPPPRRKKTYENIMSCPGDFCGYFAPPWDCWTSIG